MRNQQIITGHQVQVRDFRDTMWIQGPVKTWVLIWHNLASLPLLRIRFTYTPVTINSRLL